jgi:cytochrome oxidase Cu insertion factor (SCO1/SenC/PrrC family)
MNKREKFFARWSLSHLLIALIIGVTLTAVLVIWQAQRDLGRVDEMKLQAVEATDGASPVPPEGAPPIGGPFSLTNQDGQPTSDTAFAGKYLLIYFGYTNCPDMCPTGLQSMSIAMDRLKTDAAKVQPIFITIDPSRDTPKRLKEYDSAFYPGIVGLTGTLEQIAAVAKEFQVYYQKGEGEQDYEVDHSSLIYLMDPTGKLVTTFDEQVDPKLIIEALKKVGVTD